MRFWVVLVNVFVLMIVTPVLQSTNALLDRFVAKGRSGELVTFAGFLMIVNNINLSSVRGMMMGTCLVA